MTSDTWQMRNFIVTIALTICLGGLAWTISHNHHESEYYYPEEVLPRGDAL